MIKKIFSELANDLTIKTKTLTINNIKGAILYHKTLSNISDFNTYYTVRFTPDNIKSLDTEFPGIVEKEADITKSNFMKNIMDGFLYLFIEDDNIIYKFILPKLPERAIGDNPLDAMNTLGSQDSLIENLNKNISLIEIRLKSQKLMLENITVGTISKTEVSVLYLDNSMNKSELNEITKQLSTIDLEAVKTIDDIANVFNKGSLFPLVYTTSSPETIANSILNGRFAILIDNFPVALVVPGTLELFTNMPGEAAAPKYYLFYTRLICAILMFLSIFFLGIYVALINHHADSLSMLLISEIKASNRGSTLPLIGEILFITMVFEFLTFASSRNSAGYLQSVLITVGGLLIGQNAVSSGFVSPFNLVITALCFLSTYGITNSKYLVISFSNLRLFILFAGYFLGLLGILITSIITILYLYNLKTLKTPYLGIFNYDYIKNMFSSRFKKKTKIS